MVITNKSPDKYTNIKSIVLKTNSNLLSETFLKCVPQYVEKGLPCSIAPPTTDVPAHRSDVGEHPNMVIIII